MLRESVAAERGVDPAAVIRKKPGAIAIAQGRRDAFLDASWFEHRSFPGLWRGGVQWLDAGHAPFVETPEAFDALVLAFFKDRAL